MNHEHVIDNQPKFGELVGNSTPMKKVFFMIEKAASVDFSVLIVGETGSGKELVAREIHNRSMRKKHQFVAINTGALPTELVTSELFGYEKGAFTGANNKREGYFYEANKGTLFLDEILTMDERTQVTLLRVLESGQYRRISGHEVHQTNVRIISATNEDPAHAIQSSQFRMDLFHRLQVMRIDIPPLRKRKKDIPLLAQHFLQELSENYYPDIGISADAMGHLEAYDWPGNVRELRNVLMQAAVLNDGQEIRTDHLPTHIQQFNMDVTDWSQQIPSNIYKRDSLPSNGKNNASKRDIWLSGMDGVYLPMGLSLKEIQRLYILKTMSTNGNNKSRTAKILGLSRKTLYDKLVSWEN